MQKIFKLNYNNFFLNLLILLINNIVFILLIELKI